MNFENIYYLDLRIEIAKAATAANVETDGTKGMQFEEKRRLSVVCFLKFG